MHTSVVVAKLTTRGCRSMSRQTVEARIGQCDFHPPRVPEAPLSSSFSSYALRSSFSSPHHQVSPHYPPPSSHHAYLRILSVSQHNPHFCPFLLALSTLMSPPPTAPPHPSLPPSASYTSNSSHQSSHFSPTNSPHHPSPSHT